MKNKSRPIGLAAAFLAVGFAAYAVGYTQAYWRGIDRLRFAAGGDLSYHVEELACLRTGDIYGAERLLENSVDIAVATLPMGKPFAAQSEEAQQVLSLAKVYRSAFPSRNAAADAVLGEVPRLPSNFRYCSQAMTKVAQMNPQSAGS